MATYRCRELLDCARLAQQRVSFSWVALIFFEGTLASAGGKAGCPTDGSDESKVVVNGYVVRTIRTDILGCLEVRKNGVVVYQESEDAGYYIGKNIEGTHGIPAIKLGTNVMGGQTPQVLIGSWSGGAHCCYSFRILELGKEFRVAAKLKADDSGGAHFEDVHKDANTNLSPTIGHLHIGIRASQNPPHQK